MPERDGKTEYGGAFLSQMKSRARSLYEQVFAESYIEENEEHPEQSSESVSYTHLDVYKRQHPNRYFADFIGWISMR